MLSLKDFHAETETFKLFTGRITRKKKYYIEYEISLFFPLFSKGWHDCNNNCEPKKSIASWDFYRKWSHIHKKVATFTMPVHSHEKYLVCHSIKTLLLKLYCFLLLQNHHFPFHLNQFLYHCDNCRSTKSYLGAQECSKIFLEPHNFLKPGLFPFRTFSERSFSIPDSFCSDVIGIPWTFSEEMFFGFYSLFQGFRGLFLAYCRLFQRCRSKPLEHQTCTSWNIRC